ncbi:MAG: four helix bundle protein [Luteibaculum sp.]
MYTYSFEKLDVWNLARGLTKKIYQLTKTFPDEERFGLVSQLRRATTSIGINLAEGSGRITGKEQARFTEVSYSSLMEVLAVLILCTDLEFMSEEQLIHLRPSIDEIGNKLNAMRAAQLKRSK